MVESLLEGMLSLMHLQPVYYYERAVAKNVLPKSLIPQVSFISFETKTTYWHERLTDCAEKEAIYIITTGGINDPSAA